MSPNARHAKMPGVFRQDEHVELVTGRVATLGSGLAGGPVVAEGPGLSPLLRLIEKKVLPARRKE
jgi:hypothetical protein